MTVITSARRRLAPALAGVVGLGLAAIAVPQHVAAAPLSPEGPGCARLSELHVSQAEMQKAACLDDLTTAGTVASGHTNPNDWSGLHASGTRNPSGVPGIQVDGYFSDTSTTNGNNGWRHDSQFVIRLPDSWNGKVVISGAPGVRAQYANDFILSDWVLAQGYAFASTDKGNTGTRFYADGSTPGGSVREWHDRVTELTMATKAVVEQRYGSAAQYTYMVGISNGGYLTRWQLENRPWLYDGGLDWEGTLFRADGPTLFHYLPTALKHYPAYAATGSEAARRAMIEAGFEEGSEFLWPFHYAYYWDLTQRIYREEFDPDYDGALDAGVPFCHSGVAGCDADYDYASRPAAVNEAVRSVELTGDIQRPLITLHGNLDALLPIRTDSNVYDELVEDSHRARLHRYYRFGGGTHTDNLYSTYPDRLRPLLPCARSAFEALDRWVTQHEKPPKDGFYPKPTAGDVVNTCVL